MKTYLLWALLAFSTLQDAHAQTDKTTIAVFAFKPALPEYQKWAAHMHHVVMEVLEKKPGFVLLDRSMDSLLIRELDIQIREQSVASKVLVEQGKLLGATHILVGTITGVSAEENKASGIKTIFKKGDLTGNQYKATVSFSLQLAETETGKVVTQKVFDNSGNVFDKAKDLMNVGLGETRENAILTSIDASRKEITSWINTKYPPELKIQKIETRTRTGKPETVLVTGIDESFKKGAQFIVKEVEPFITSDGNSVPRIKKIATLKIKEFQGAVAVCSVTDGEDVLEEKMNAKTTMTFEAKKSLL